MNNMEHNEVNQAQPISEFSINFELIDNEPIRWVEENLDFVFALGRHHKTKKVKVNGVSVRLDNYTIEAEDYLCIISSYDKLMKQTRAYIEVVKNSNGDDVMMLVKPKDDEY